MVRYFSTIEEMKRAYYPPEILAQADELLKADAPVLTTTTGVRNAIFGAMLFEQVITSATALGVLAKKPWEKSGYRAITAEGSTSGLGLAESALVPDTIKPTFAEVTVPPKLMAHTYDMSIIQNALDGKDDVARWADLMDYMEREFLQAMNANLWLDNDTLSQNNIESIDRVIGSYSEIAGVGQTANDLDIYGIDRDASAGWTDAYVSHNSGTDRVLSLDLVDTVLTNVRPYWDPFSREQNKVFFTTFGTLERWQQLLQAQQRFERVDYQTGVNGIQTLRGAEGGFNLATYQGIPIFPDDSIQADTIGRIYVVDGEYLHIGVLEPVQHTESQDYQLLGKFTREGMNFMSGNVVCTKFKAQGKVRDLK